MTISVANTETLNAAIEHLSKHDEVLAQVIEQVGPAALLRTPNTTVSLSTASPANS